MSEFDEIIGVPDDGSALTKADLDETWRAMPAQWRPLRMTFYIREKPLLLWNVWFENEHPLWALQVKQPIERFWKWWNDAGENPGFETVCVTKGFEESQITLSDEAKQRLRALPRWEQNKEMKSWQYKTRFWNLNGYWGPFDDEGNPVK